MHPAVQLAERLGIHARWDIERDDFNDWYAEFSTNDPMEVLLFCLCYSAGSVVVCQVEGKWAVSAFEVLNGVSFVG